MKITKNKRLVEGYETECPRCNQIIKGVSVKSLNHNFKMHKMFCKGSKTNKLQEEENE